MKPIFALAAALLLTAQPAAIAGTGTEAAVAIPSFPQLLRRQWTVEDVQPKAESKQYLRTRDDSVERMSLREAVGVALENNPGIAAERLGPLFARANVERANGVFDPVLEADGSIERSVTPSSSALEGSAVVRERNNIFGFSVRKLLRTGATLTMTSESTEVDTNSRFYVLRPAYVPTVEFTLDQPLLKNFGLDLTVLVVRSAEANSSAAYYQFQARVVDLVRRVVGAYWGVVRAREDLRVQRDGLRLAQTLVKENEARVRAGTLPPVAVKEAEAEAASRDEQVISAENALGVANDTLRLLLQSNPEGTFLPRPIDPTDNPEVREVDTDEVEMLETAVARRPEVQQARYDIENRKIQAKIARNNLLPSLDAQASYGLNGLAGRGVPVTDPATGETVVSRFTGNYGRALDRMFSDDYNSYSAGLSLTIPFANATARAEYTQSEIDVRRAELNFRQLLADVTLQVRKAIGDVRSNSKRITATRLARELAQENLEQQHKRYDVGLATTKDILDFQTRLTAARAAEIQALIDYNVSLAALRQAEGTLLGRFDIVLDRLPPSPTPLWAKF